MRIAQRPVAGGDGHVIDVVVARIARCLEVRRGLEHERTRLRVDIELELVRAAGDRISHCVAIDIARHDSGRRRAVFRDRDRAGRASTIAGDHWRFVDIRHRDGNRLRIGLSPGRGGYGHIIDVVGTRIRFGFKVGSRLEAERAGGAVDIEQRGIRAAADRIGNGCPFGIAGNHCGDCGGVLRNRDRRRIAAAVRGNHGRLVDIDHGDRDRLRIRQRAVAHRHGYIIDIVRARVGRRLEVRCGLERQRAGCGIDLEFACVRASGNRIAQRARRLAVGRVDRCHGRAVLEDRHCSARTGTVGIDHRRGVVAEHLQLDADAAGIANTAFVLPDHAEIAACKAAHAREALIEPRVGGDKELAADFRPVGMENLRRDAIAARVTILADRVHPRDGEIAVGERCDLGGPLIVTREGVDENLPADLRPVGVKQLRLDARAAEIAADAALVFPRDDEVAIGKTGNISLLLGPVGRGVDKKFAADLGAVRAVDLRLDRIVRVRCGGALVRGPAYDKAAVCKPADRRLDLRPGGDRVDEELAAHLAAIRRKDLRLDAVVAVAAEPAGVPPGHDKAAAGKAGHGRRDLLAGGLRVCLEFGADFHARRIEGLPVDLAAEAVP